MSGAQVQAGAAIVDITPPAGLPMVGYAARTGPALGSHDALTARAIAVDDTAVVCADVLGVDAGTVAEITRRVGMGADRLIVSGLHTHGGPASMPGRCSLEPDPAFMEQLVEGCVQAVVAARLARRSARLFHGLGADPGIAVNRRHDGGTVDSTLPVLHIRDLDDNPIAIMTSYACHPVVLGADNRLWTADYPGVVREQLEEHWPGAVALFLTGCIGDANIGHSAQASISTEKDPTRTFDNAERIGKAIAARVMEADCRPVGGGANGLSGTVAMGFERREAEGLTTLAQSWEQAARDDSSVNGRVKEIWADWAKRFATADIDGTSLTGPVAALQWGNARIIGLPGEIFARTAIDIRAATSDPAAFVIGFAGDNPGYIAPDDEYLHGGYEIDEAHRYYGLPATFAKGTAEALAEAAIALVDTLNRANPGTPPGKTT